MGSDKDSEEKQDNSDEQAIIQGARRLSTQDRDVRTEEEEESEVETVVITQEQKRFLKDDSRDKEHKNILQKRLTTYAMLGLCILLFSHIAVFTTVFIVDIIMSTEVSLASSVDIINSTFSMWLPVLSGFAGSIITYFFVKDK